MRYSVLLKRWRLVWWGNLGLCIFMFLNGPSAPIQAAAQDNLSHARTRLKIVPEGMAITIWRVMDAGLQQEATGTTGYLEIQNASSEPIPAAFLYAEYFDASRVCFTLLFSQDTNLDAQNPIGPGETRKLFSVAPGLIPAIQPTEIHVYAMSSSNGSERPLRFEGTSVRAPVTVDSSIASSELRLQLDPKTVHSNGSIQGLLLATVDVDERGDLVNLEVLDAPNKAVEAWFQGFARELTFYPATDDGVPVRSSVFVRVQAVFPSQSTTGDFPMPTQALNQYTVRNGTAQIPPVTQIILQRPSTKMQLKGSKEFSDVPPAPPGALDVTSFGSDWSTSAYRWVADPLMPHRRARRLIGGGPR